LLTSEIEPAKKHFSVREKIKGFCFWGGGTVLIGKKMMVQTELTAKNVLS